MILFRQVRYCFSLFYSANDDEPLFVTVLQKTPLKLDTKLLGCSSNVDTTSFLIIQTEMKANVFLGIKEEYNVFKYLQDDYFIIFYVVMILKIAAIP